MLSDLDLNCPRCNLDVVFILKTFFVITLININSRTQTMVDKRSVMKHINKLVSRSVLTISFVLRIAIDGHTSAMPRYVIKIRNFKKTFGFFSFL